MEARTYRELADRRTGEDSEVLRALADAEGRHETHWRDLLGDQASPTPKPPLSSRIRAFLARRFGAVFVLAMAQRSEQRTAYDLDADATAQMAADEHIHGEVVRGLAARSRTRMAGTLRAAVFGANDGLVSNLALILGVAGTGVSAQLVLFTGIAGLLSGALSMAAGEFVSVSSQRELLEASEPDPLADRSVPELDVRANELELVYRARGEAPEHAKNHARQVFARLEAERAHREAPRVVEMGLTEAERPHPGSHEEIGTPWRAASSSFLSFCVGAIVPLVPYAFGMGGLPAVVASAGIVGLALLVTGGMVGILSGQSPLRRSLRQLGIGYGAAAVTYVVGLLSGGIVRS